MKRIAFLCVENAGRSQMAAAFAREMAGDRVIVLSGGTRPARSVNPTVVEAMREVGIDISRERPRSLSFDDLADSDYVITMGCESRDVCPAALRADVIDWNLRDPKDRSLEEVREIRDDIRRRVKDLINQLKAED